MTLRKLLCLPALAAFVALTAVSFAQTSQVDGHGAGIAPSLLERPANPPLVNLGKEANPRVLTAPVAPPASGDDNENTTPTAWWIYTGQSATDITNTVNSLNARIIDINVDSFSPYSFTVTYVHDTGSYAKTWWWYYGIDSSSLLSLLNTNNARAISFKAYDIGSGDIRYAVVMIANTGADQKAYWVYSGKTVDELSSLLSTNNARLTSIQSYKTQGKTRYAAIMISNTGADASAWWWYVGATLSEISGLVTTNNARIIDVNHAGSGTFNVIMESCANGCAEWWWYVGITPDQAVSIAIQNGARIVTANTYSGCGGTCFDVAMINNVNAITTRVGNILRSNGVGGVQGLYLKQVGKSVLANLEDNVTYEPASSIKVLAHLYAITQVQYGTVSLKKKITHYTNGPASCPDPPIVKGTEPLITALQEMMWHSDNARTREITDFFGDANINAFAKTIGMKHTSINHIIGCGGPTPDKMTQDDAAVLYGAVAKQTVLDPIHRGIFYSLMAGKAEYEVDGYDWTGIWDADIPNIISQEAPSDYTAAQKQAFQNAMNLAYKAGSYVICQNDSCSSILEHLSESGWFEVPFCEGSSTTLNQYVFGIFLSKAPDNSWFNGKTTAADKNFNNAKSELLREQIQAGLDSCDQKSLKIVSLSPAPLTFSARTVGSSSSAKTVTLHNKQNVAVTGISVKATGDFSQTNNCGTGIAAGASCMISVVFKPTAVGARNGALVVADGASNTPQGEELIGTGK
ncbi:MAG: choice-of-anchor D domain-containing protein [Terriglobales bacterium]